MAQKDCDPKCTGKCNKKRFAPISTANKGCDPKCTGRCSKRNAATSSIENPPPPAEKPPVIDEKEKEIEVPVEENKEEEVPVILETEEKSIHRFLQPGEVNYVIMDLDGVILGMSCREIESVVDHS